MCSSDLYTVKLPEYFQTTYAHEQPKLGAPDAAAARLTKLSITGATQTVPPTITPALRRLRREIGELIRLSSALDSSDMSLHPVLTRAYLAGGQIELVLPQGSNLAVAGHTTIAPKSVLHWRPTSRGSETTEPIEVPRVRIMTIMRANADSALRGCISSEPEGGVASRWRRIYPTGVATSDAYVLTLRRPGRASCM